ncbi:MULTISPECIES: VOC family protein [Photobacterium]|uniref:Glyoxalase n=1 Tax=Photobacterium ganghwense TaxID=320778 RepID=A0A0J1H9U4_9GAMM|nr:MULTISPECIES: VOC family protein [Photobacterium]KLV08444.1 glyoxalase [Photobacterium ganghwense]MBV1839712.1 VOC family protein [Photobacterium ganghwense]PSU07575.1 glyoxalase/bleomycin resistance/dioxygenase family protein [Photobacterium ganghwense]QSV15917.1 VOC family protein [Photobacterium ganghwense]
MIPTDSTLRVVRPTDNVNDIAIMYSKALGFEMLKQFKDHEGFDGVVLGHKKHPYHLEFVHQIGTKVGKAPTQEHLLVFYVDCSQAWERACRSMIDAGFSVVESSNPYWEQVGKTFEDIDGYRVVLQNRDWDK